MLIYQGFITLFYIIIHTIHKNMKLCAKEILPSIYSDATSLEIYGFFGLFVKKTAVTVGTKAF